MLTFETYSQDRFLVAGRLRVKAAREASSTHNPTQRHRVTVSVTATTVDNGQRCLTYTARVLFNEDVLISYQYMLRV